jgi:hypothetical protein
MVFIVIAIKEKETPVSHNWVMLLSNLIALRVVSVVVVLAIELDVVGNSAAQTQTANDSFVQAVFVQNGEHSGEGQVNIISKSIWLV